MRKMFLILMLSAAAALAVPIDSLVAAWSDRNSLSAEITQMNISPIDTAFEKGIIRIRKPNAIFQTESELVLYIDGELYTFSAGSDVGTVSKMDDFAYSNIGGLIERLDSDFDLSLEKEKSGYRLAGSGGSGNIVSFSAELDDGFLPKRIRWNDIFDYTTIWVFDNIRLGDTGDAFEIPDSIEFIRQE